MSSPQYSAEASFQARGNTMNGCELIVTEVATGTSDISHQDAFKNAQAAAQDAAQKKLKEELMKINTGSSCQMIVCGPPGPMGADGKRGARGNPGVPGQDGVFANIKIPLQLVGKVLIKLDTKNLTPEQIAFLKLLASITGGLGNSTRQDDSSILASSFKNISNVCSKLITDISQGSTNVNIPPPGSDFYGTGSQYSDLGPNNSSKVSNALEAIVENNEYDLDPIFKNFILLYVPNVQEGEDDSDVREEKASTIFVGLAINIIVDNNT